MRGREFIEIQSCRPNFSLQGYWLIGIDGENFFNPGNIHWAIDLSAYSTGSNGLLLVRDGEAVLQPEPAAETTVAVIPFAFTEAGMGNDSYTVALVRNFTGRPTTTSTRTTMESSTMCCGARRCKRSAGKTTKRSLDSPTTSTLSS
jgi:hypothetical protein